MPIECFVHKNTRRIIIDAGHGAPDGGAVGSTDTTESELNLAVATVLRERLVSQGFSVTMTRESERGIYEESAQNKKRSDMQNRLKIMRETDADMFVSIHMNHFTSSAYYGAEVLYSKTFAQSALLGESIMESLRAIDPPNQTRQAKAAPSSLYLMKNASMPAVIVECGFMSNTQEEALLLSETYQVRLADAICAGIIKYYNSVLEGSI
ncbi:MAG: N-acetylmuramoyl-L-alanine amidase [Clostridia bacterium]|nr:N-acetylmuramoyl-L-alanine amidase [Clostridia bacterium]